MDSLRASFMGKKSEAQPENEKGVLKVRFCSVSVSCSLIEALQSLTPHASPSENPSSSSLSIHHSTLLSFQPLPPHKP